MGIKRIYLVKHRVGDVVESRLVEATNQAQAVSHVVRTRVECRVATQEDLVTHIGSGAKVECSKASVTEGA